jgi:uncharacterized membrane protein
MVVRMALVLARGGAPTIDDGVRGLKHAFSVMLGELVLMLVVVVGGAALIVPGVVAYVALSMFAWFAVDEELDAFNALRAAWIATDGHRGKLAAFAALSTVFLAFGVLLLGVGLLYTWPLVWVAQAIVYVRITGRTTPPTSSSA